MGDDKTTLSELLSLIATRIGGLVAAARSDIETANPEDVGLDGVSVLAWRKAYEEGCRDMANQVFNSLPEDLRVQFQTNVKAAMTAEAGRSTLSETKEG